MGMANLQRMAQQMQQEMLRVQAELESAHRRRLGRRRRRQATVTGKQELVSVTIDPVGGRSGRRRDAPGPRRRRRQRRAARLARARRAEDGRGHRRPAHPRHVGRPPAWPPRHRARRAPDRGVRAPARDRPEDRPAADLPPPARPRRRGPDAGRARSSPSATRSSSATAASTSATSRSARSAAIRAATRRGCASSRSRSTSSPSSGPASSRAATTSSTARSRRSTGSGRTACKIRELLERADEAARDGDAVRGGHHGHQPDARGRGDRDVPRRAPRGGRSARSAGSPAACRSAATSSTPTR